MKNTVFRQRSFPCNGNLIASLRQKKQWTQLELGKAAGYSERLIGKAESGAPLSLPTIENLAEALSTPDQLIQAEDLMCSPVQLAKEFIVALYRHQAQTLDAISHFLDEACEFHIAGNPQEIPFAGVYRGHDEARQLFERFFAVMTVPLNHDPMPYLHFVGNESDVVVWGESWLQPFGMPITEPMPITHLLRFRKGKLYYLEDRFDTEAAGRIFEKKGEIDPEA